MLTETAGIFKSWRPEQVQAFFVIKTNWFEFATTMRGGDQQPNFFQLFLNWTVPTNVD